MFNLNLIIFFIFFKNVLPNKISEGNFSMEAPLNKKLEVHVKFQDPKLIMYKIPVSIKIKFVKITFESMLKPNQTVSIKSNYVKSKFQLKKKYRHSIERIERKICLMSQKNKSDILSLEITNESQESVAINVTARDDENSTINIGENRTITVDDNSPISWLLKFNDTNVNMEIRIDSTDDQCMYVLIEKAECSPDILNPQMKTISGKTITKKGSIPIKNLGQYKSNSLFIVFILTENNICNKNIKSQNNSIKQIFRQKNFNITFVNIDIKYQRNIIGLFSIFISIGFIYVLFYCKIWESNPDNQDQSNDSGTTDVDKSNEKYFGKYCINCNCMFVIVVFYALPVIQLLWHFHKIIDEHGNFDKCYHNDHCSKPLGSIISFNNVISNIGFIILGITFITIVSINYYFMSKNSLKSTNRWIFYALGFSLIMEGIMSASYHICPRSDNIQFDLTFMYIIGCLLNFYYAIKLLQIFGKSEINIDEKIKEFFFFMSTVMLSIFLLSIFENKIPNGIIAIFHFTTISISIYKIFYSGNVKWCDFFTRRNLYSFAILFVNVIVFGHSINKGFYSYFIIVILVNFSVLMVEYYAIILENMISTRSDTILYTILSSCRKNRFTFITFIGSIICCIFAMKSFSLATSNRQAILSNYRKFNEDCIWGHFFDIHDISHILSSISIFLSFMWIFIIDGKIVDYKIKSLENN